MGYLLDTNIVSRLARKRPPEDLLERIRGNRYKLFISSITIEELMFGVCKAPVKDQPALQAFVDGLSSHLHVVPYDLPAARWAARFRYMFFQKRRTIEYPDICIAAIAASRGLILVTHNVKDFDDFPDLHIEDWVG